jgi:hypothetical protein
MATTKSKASMISDAALELRVQARKRGRITDEMAADAIAVLQTRWERAGIKLIPLSSQAVVRKAQRELAANGEFHPYF